MSEEEKQAIEYLNDFKSIKIMYGNTFVMFLEQLKKYQQATNAALNLITKLQKENEELRKGQNSLMQSRKKWKDRYYKLKAKSRKIIDLMAQNIELQQFANIDTTDIDLICKRLHCNKKCRLVRKECIKKYFTRIIRR